MKEISFVDTTIRDGHASLWAEGLTTGMMLPIASRMERMGFKSIELIATSHFLKSVRELREDPWERIRMISGKIKNTPLAMIMLPSVSAFDLTPFSVLRLFMERIAANGIRRVSLTQSSNDYTFKIPECIQYCKEVGLEVALSLLYSHSPRHTDEYFSKKAREAVQLGVDTLYLKDPGGLLTPERVRTLVPAILPSVGKTPFELHSHCTTGLAPLVYLEAVKLGVTTLHTAIPPLANGSSQPSLPNMIKNTKALGYRPVIDEREIKPITDHLTYVAKSRGFPIGIPLEYDVDQYRHQVPGGVISNLKHQLAQLRMDQRLDEVLDEVAEVCKDLGYPIMVTPFSQFIVSQAAMNVMMGERYKQVSDEIIRYAIGFWGNECVSVIEPDIKDKILERPRAKELANVEPPQPSIKEVREKMGGPELSDDELLLRYIVKDEKEIAAMRQAGPIKEYISATNPLVALIHELTKMKNLSYVNVVKKEFSLSLSRNPES